MKISYRTHPALEFLEDGIAGKMQLFLADQEHFELRVNNYDSYEAIFKLFDDSKIYFNKSIQLITKPFHDAIHFTFHKMLDPELLKNQTNISGTIIDANDYVNFYRLDNDEFIIFIFFDKKLIFLLRGGNDISKHISFFSEANYKIDFGDVYNYESIVPVITANLMATINFIKYAKIETKYLPAKQRTKDFNCKYVNDTNLNINALDCKWITTLIQKNGFSVRGHFRFQPKKKDGEWTKEIIYIESYEKHGYTAPARKLKEYPEQL